ncbi:helix-turn-helix transcriptional regulator [Flavobacterium granuli]|uniref:DNA-binding XRE family transcriptional regulator n=1 Tax=Flavobacterium granuli TaxID=280093 RepID=A0ABU1RZX9_9FLAO|nr:helix-turn-helix transcriptional regulator [Flavobacterium granuli]MDR6844327.1 DNA-binding XRE family transcriptional regulator [Flavobacterium granuli]
MVNTDDFIKRLEIILDYYSLNASSFADKIGVQRSSMSHLLSGRNKPSLDFILKIIEVFPDVDLYWILNGKGVFPKNSEVSENLNSNSTVSNIDTTPTPIDLFSQISIPDKPNIDHSKTREIKTSIENENTDEVEKIIFFYKNGTFKIYSPN